MQAQDDAARRDLRPGGIHRRGRPRLSRGDLPQRAGRRSRTGCICACSIPTRAASTTWSTTPPTIPRCASRYLAARARTPARPGPASSPARSSSPRAPRSASRWSAASAALDDRWQTLFSVAADQGEAVGGRRIFRLQVEGVAGDDANLYGVTLSLRDRRNLAPAGSRDRRFRADRRGCRTRRGSPSCASAVPADAERLTVRNFDAANGSLAFVSAFRSVPLAASGQDEWRESEIVLQPDERGQVAAITFAGGDEIPNDVTFEIRDQAGQLLPIELPARLWRPNQRPLPEADVELLANCVSVAFDASRSTDPDGDQLSYEWQFGDGATRQRPGAGPSVSRTRHLRRGAAPARQLGPGRRGRRAAASRCSSSGRRSRSPARTWWSRRARP